jgi:transcriptional regulator with XRE-family HTH domain
MFSILLKNQQQCQQSLRCAKMPRGLAFALNQFAKPGRPNMLLLLMLQFQADAIRLGRLTRLSSMTLKEIALGAGVSSENLLAGLGGRRPLPSGERLAKLQKVLGVNITTGNIDNSQVLLWKLKTRNLNDFVALSAELFPADRSTFRTDLIFEDLQQSVCFCLHSNDFVVVLIPCAGLSFSHLNLTTKRPLKLDKTLRQFCELPADEAQALIRRGKATWKDAVSYLQSLRISPEQAMQWGTKVHGLEADTDTFKNAGHDNLT